MDFKHSCFVWVNKEEDIKNLLSWLNNIGYATHMWATMDNLPKLILCRTTPKGKAVAICYNSSKGVRRPNINCGFNMEMFKAIAAMNDCNALEQWFIDDRGSFIKCPDKMLTKAVIPSYANYRKATIYEILVHFSGGYVPSK